MGRLAEGGVQEAAVSTQALPTRTSYTNYMPGKLLILTFFKVRKGIHAFQR